MNLPKRLEMIGTKSNSGSVTVTWTDRNVLEELATAIEQDIEEILDLVEPCEPDCSDVRHAYHQGQWDLYQRQLTKLHKYIRGSDE